MANGLQLEDARAAWPAFVLVYGWFLAMQLLDLGSTLLVLRLGGIEANPMGPVQVLEALGPEGLLLLKVLLIVVTMAAWTGAIDWLLRRPRQERRLAMEAVLALLVALNLFYMAVVSHNLLNVGRLL